MGKNQDIQQLTVDKFLLLYYFNNKKGTVIVKNGKMKHIALFPS